MTPTDPVESLARTVAVEAHAGQGEPRQAAGMFVAAVGLVLCLGACSPAWDRPDGSVPVDVPGIPADTATLCLGPPGTHLRAFIGDTNGRQVTSVVNVANLPPTNPWSCP